MSEKREEKESVFTGYGALFLVALGCAFLVALRASFFKKDPEL